MAACYVFLTCLMKLFARPAISLRIKDRLWMGWCLMISSWKTLGEYGSKLHYQCTVPQDSHAWQTPPQTLPWFATNPMTSSYLVCLSTRTLRCLPSLVATLCSTTTTCHGSSDGMDGLKGSLLVTLVAVRQDSTLLSTLISMPVNQSLDLSILLAVVMPGCPKCSSWCCNNCPRDDCPRD